MGLRAGLTVLLLALAGLAGCAQSGAAPASTSSPSESVPVVPSVDPERPTGIIDGKVLDDEYVPILGADVVLVGFNVTAKTGEDGSFRFGEVNVGDYFLAARASGYKEHQVGVSVTEDQTTSLKIFLVSIPKPVSRIETLQARHALNCRLAIGHPVGTTQANSKNTCIGAAGANYVDNRTGSLLTTPGLVGFIIEEKWQQNQQTSHALELNVTLPFTSGTSNKGTSWEVRGPSPLSIIVKRADLDAYSAVPKRTQFFANGGRVSYGTDVAPGVTGQAVDFGFALDQKADFFFTLFYVVEPEKYESYKQFT